MSDGQSKKRKRNTTAGCKQCGQDYHTHPQSDQSQWCPITLLSKESPKCDARDLIDEMSPDTAEVVKNVATLMDTTLPSSSRHLRNAEEILTVGLFIEEILKYGIELQKEIEQEEEKSKEAGDTTTTNPASSS